VTSIFPPSVRLLAPKSHLIPVSTTTTPRKIGDQLSTVTLISPGKKPASSTLFLLELLNLVYFLFFFYSTILVQFCSRETNARAVEIAWNFAIGALHYKTHVEEKGLIFVFYFYSTIVTAAARGAPRHDQRRVKWGSTFESDSLANQSTPRSTYTS